MLGVLERDGGENLLRLSPVALVGHQHGYFVPDVLEALVIVRDRLGEHHLVRDVDDATGALIRVHPDADLVQCELEEMHVDDVAPVLGDFDAIADVEGPPPDDERPCRQVGERVLQRNRDTRRDDPEECGEGFEAFEPLAPDHHDRDREGDVGDRLPPAVA